MIVSLATAGLAGFGYPARAVQSGLGTGAAHLSVDVSTGTSHASAKPIPSVGPVQATVTISNAPKAYWLLPYTVAWNISASNITIAKTPSQNTWLSVSVNDITGSGRCVQRHTCPLVANLSANGSVANGVTSYTYTITTANLTVGGYNGGVLPSDQFLVQVWATLNNGVNNLTTGASRQPFLVPGNPTAGFAAPLAGASISTGNITLGVNYSGSYIQGAQLTIYQGPSYTSQVVYSQGVFSPGSGQHLVIASAVWYVGVPGAYLERLNLTTPFGWFNYNQTLTVIAAGNTVYSNSTSWTNESIWGGVAPGTVGALLLVAGLIIGMIVALALGRAMWGSPRATPAQAWQAKPSNECPICHQTFATEAELKEHSKTAHGM